MRELDINEVAKRSGLPASTLRYYDEIKLIRSIGRKGIRRVFDESVLERLALVSLGRAAGFSLEEIARMFAPQGGVKIDRQLLTKKAKELEISIKRMTSMRDGLRHAASCPAPSHLECPKFRRLMGIAAATTRIAKKSSERQ